MNHVLEKDLGAHHHEIFHTYIAIIGCYRYDRNLIAAEEAAELLIQRSSSSLQMMKYLPHALRKSSHVLKDLSRYPEAMGVCHRILDQDPTILSNEMCIYTKEDLAELHRIQGNLLMESLYLSQALETSRVFFGKDAAPSLHILDKLELSLSEQAKLEARYS